MLQWISVRKRNIPPNDLLGFFRVNRGSKAFGVHEELSEKHNEKESPRLCFRFTFRSFPASIFEAFFAYFSSKNTPRKLTFLRTDLRCAIWAHFHAKKPPKSSQKPPQNASKKAYEKWRAFSLHFWALPSPKPDQKGTRIEGKNDAKNRREKWG